MPTFTNKLINENSPYLLQHAHNPVNWFPWGNEALAKAKEENKPILVSIGYSACHWCHVMERESFENEETAAIMNQYFVNIKIDREERPDIDHIYMDAVQAITGSGGWPLNVFLTADAKPFYGGTYFPPQPAYNRPSWTDTLLGVAKAFNERRHEIDAQAENLTSHLLQSNSFGISKIEEEKIINHASVDLAAENILKNFDSQWGGFGKAPKFSQSFCIQFLLRYSHVLEPILQTNESAIAKIKANVNLSGSQIPSLGGGGASSSKGRQASLFSLNKMMQGGIYDQIGGGFARYSTDTEWLAPHFEKMLYDNALLVSVISEAYHITGEQHYKEVIDETISFVKRELLSPESGFYAALDADSEGVEGKYYVWGKEEIENLLGKDAEVFCHYYDVTDSGNWEHSNILRVKIPFSQFAKENNLNEAELKQQLHFAKQILLSAREKRIKPGLDDKTILGWNALMNIACAKAFIATKNESYKNLAIANMHFMLKAFQQTDGSLLHTYKNGKAKYPAFLDDYAYLINALIHLAEITANNNWLLLANDFTTYVQQHFKEEDTPFFFYTSSTQTDVIVRKKEVYDGATPSGNSVMAHNLWKLSIVFDKPNWRQQALDMLSSLGNAITRYPTSFANWACLLHEVVAGSNEIVVSGSDFQSIYNELLHQYLPHRLLIGVEMPQQNLPFTAAKNSDGKTAIYLCRNNTCMPPVFSTAALTALINKG